VRSAIAARKRKAPSKENGCLPVAARGNDLLIVSQSLSQRLPGVDPVAVAFEWDYVMPDGSLPLSGESISLGSSDRWAYGAIPADDFSALYRVGRIGVYSANSSPHGVVVWSDRGNVAFVTAFSSDALDRHRFIASLAEAAALDSTQIAGWHAIYGDYAGGTGFAGYGRRVVVMGHPVCRFYLPPPDGAHFFSASEAECADVHARFSRLVLESDNTFCAGLPDLGSGACAPGPSPLYRMWYPTTNDHWYTADDDVRPRAMSQGYVPEGHGSDGVSMCVIGTCCGNAC
jgi:hypothetical protein